MPVTVVPMSAATSAIDTFITDVSRVIRNCPVARVRSTVPAAVVRASAVVITRAAEAHVAGRAVRRVAHPGRHAVATAVVLVTEVRTAPHDHVLGVESAGGPLPDVAGHVVEAEAVGREGVGRT